MLCPVNRPLLARCVIALALLAGSAGVTAASAGLPWATRSYHSTDGLPSNVINDITQDQEGFLWLATDVGLVRFDGQQFEMWGSAGEAALPAVWAETVLASRDRSLWVGLGRGLCQILPTRVVRCPAELQDAFITGVIEDRAGRIWVGSRRGVTRLVDGRWRALGTHEGLPAQVNVTGLRETRDGDVWVATVAGHFRCSGEPRRCAVVPGLSHAMVREDSDGRLWATDPAVGVRRLDPRSPSVPPNPRRPVIRGESLLPDGKGHVWVGTPDQGLWMLDDSARSGSGGRVRQMLSVEDVGEGIRAFFEDRSGSIWIGTRAGLLRLFQPPLVMVAKASGLTHNEVRALQATPEGDVWVATRNRLHRFRVDGPMTPVETHDVGDQAVLSLALDFSPGALLVGTSEGVSRVEGGRIAPLVAPQPLGAVQGLVVVREGVVWLCHDGGASVSRWQGSALTRLTDVGGIVGKQCTGVPHVDSHGRVRQGFTDGTILIEDQGRFSTLMVKGAVAAMYEGAHGTFWVATTRGLFRIRDGSVTGISRLNGLPGDFFTSLAVDRSGALWLGLRAGIVRLRTEEFERAITDSRYQVAYQFFDSSDGLPDAPAKLGGPASVVDAAGRLWFQTLGGAALIDEQHADLARQQARASVERLRVDDGVPMFRPQDVQLAPNPTRIQIDFTAVHLSDATKVRFRYKLDGFDRDWVEAGSRRQAFFTALPPGNYRFVLAARLNGVEQSTATLAFSVRPAFYETRWFLGLGVLLAVSGLAAGWKLRTRRLRRSFALVLEERARISRELHDTILQALAGLALQIEGMAQQQDGMPTAMGLRRLRRQVEQHIHDTRHAILGLRSGEEAGRPLAERLKASASELVMGTGVEVAFSVEGEARGLSPQREEQVMRIAQEAIRNASRHSGAGVVLVTLAYATDGLTLTVRDEGKGFTPDEELSRRGERWGVQGMRERARKAHARFSLDSKPGFGTTVTIDVPESPREDS